MNRRPGRLSADRIALAAVLLLSFFLRVRRLGEQRVWWDEGFSVWLARFPFADMLRETGNDVHPPLYFALLHLWRALSGDSEFGLRFLSTVLGTLTVALTYVLGRRMARGNLPEGAAAWVGVLAALLLAVSRFAVAWSMEIRMYALATLLAVLGVWAARRVWAGGGLPTQLVYILSMAGGLLTIYLFAPVVVAVNIAWLPIWHGATDRRRAVIRWAALQLAVLALVVPWLLYAAGGFLSTSSATPITLLDFLHIYWTVLTVGIPVDVAQFNRWTLPALGVLLAATGALLATAGAGQRTTDNGRQATERPVMTAGIVPTSATLRRDLMLLLVMLLLPAIIVYVVSLPKQGFYAPPFNPRYLVIFTPFYSILHAWGIMVLGRLAARRFPSAGPLLRRGLPAALAAYMLATAWVGLRPYHAGRVLADDYPSLADTLHAHHQTGDAVILYTDTDWPIFAYHWPGDWRGVPNRWTITPAIAADFLAPVWEAHDGLWLVTTPYSASADPAREMPAWLERQAAAARSYDYGDMALTFYARTPERAATIDALGPLAQEPRPLAVDLPAGRLTGYGQAAHDYKSGEAIHLFLYGDGSPTTTVGLLGDDGIARQETAVDWSAGTLRRQVDLLVSPDTPPGDYRFFVRDAAAGPVPFGRLTIRQKQAAFVTEQDVRISNRLDTRFEDGITLLGFDLPATTVRPGETLSLTLYWQADAPPTRQYKVFTQLLGDVYNIATDNFLWGQLDSEPVANTRPTTTWRSGEVIVDRYDIPVQPDAPAGRYQLLIGLYEPVSGARLTVLDGAGGNDYLVLANVEVEE